MAICAKVGLIKKNVLNSDQNGCPTLRNQQCSFIVCKGVSYVKSVWIIFRFQEEVVKIGMPKTFR